jgi:DNA replication protein DnaC
MREYELKKNKSARLYQEKMEHMYDKIPRVKEIDETLSKLGFELVALVLRQGADREKAVADMQETEEALRYERGKLLKKHKYTPQYFDEAYACSACKDTAFINNERCNCLKQRLINKHYEMSNLSKILNIENFGNFKLDYYTDEPDEKYGVSPRMLIQKNVEKCKDFIKSFENKTEDTCTVNLFLYGDTGLGKTYLCNCVAKELLDNGHSVLYLTAPELFKNIETIRFGKEKDNETLTEKMELVYSTDLLIVDDLGSEFSTAVTASEFFNILNMRLLNRKQTIFSTNLMPKDLADIYTDRVTSRIVGNFNMLLFVGDDIREYKKYNSIKN